MKPNLGRDYIIRQAYEFEGPVIQDLYQDTLVALLDWDAPLDASWVLAVIGRLEMLRVSPTVGKRLKACIVRDIIHYSLLTLKAYGCQAVTAFPEHDPTNTFQRVIERRFKGQLLNQTCSAYITRF